VPMLPVEPKIHILFFMMSLFQSAKL
jgi:hypothetical protein